MFHRRDSESPPRVPALRSFAPCVQRASGSLQPAGPRHPRGSPREVHRGPCPLVLGSRLPPVLRLAPVSGWDTLPEPRGLAPHAEPSSRPPLPALGTHGSHGLVQSLSCDPLGSNELHRGGERSATRGPEGDSLPQGSTGRPWTSLARDPTAVVADRTVPDERQRSPRGPLEGQVALPPKRRGGSPQPPPPPEALAGSGLAAVSGVFITAVVGLMLLMERIVGLTKRIRE